jgi:beta-glucan synthesis-associated protein KRE6
MIEMNWQQHWYHNLEYSPANVSDINPFFYGVTLVHWPKTKTYQSDAISANRQLNKTHYEKQHKYRIEWEPPNEDGKDGYVKWYTDDELVFGLHGESLELTRTEIPSEPMYLIMNVAVSHTWGFPMCPDGCDCKCYECDNPACKCALPNGYCENFPASFEIDYVRVWQAKNNTKHILGCSPEHRPTEQYIKGHIEKFVVEGQKRPLEPIRTGGALCVRHSDCGSKIIMGSCMAGVCVCNTNYTGPNCRTSVGHFDTKRPRTRFSCK